jgi:hypothetical protein
MTTLFKNGTTLFTLSVVLNVLLPAPVPVIEASVASVVQSEPSELNV